MSSRDIVMAAAGTSGTPEYVEDVFSTYLYTGNNAIQRIDNGIALADEIKIAPGTALGGGHFAGLISTSANGVATHALIVSPKESGFTISAWKTSDTSSNFASFEINGPANSAALNDLSHPAAYFCEGLTINGYSDWYLPSLFELEICYFNFRPSNTFGNNPTYGTNLYSVPKRDFNYTSQVPPVTSVTAFQQNNTEWFEAYHWSSNQATSSEAWGIDFQTGQQFASVKSGGARVRAVRRIPVSDPSLDPYRVTGGKGGMVWVKSRNSAQSHFIVDTQRGFNEVFPDGTAGTNGQQNVYSGLIAPTSSGFQLMASAYSNFATANLLGEQLCSWTFRKAPKFFDVVTYTGNGSNRTIAHNLGSVPGMIIVKRTDSTADWAVYHRSLSSPGFYYLNLNNTNAEAAVLNYFASTAPTSSVFSVGNVNETNAGGGTYVAYLFAHDAGGFGAAGTDNVISCGSFTTDGSGKATVNLGYEPQYLLIKRSDSTSNWFVFDTMRGMSRYGYEVLFPNLTSSTGTAIVAPYVIPTATGFQTNGISAIAANASYIYMAIRRPMKTPTSGTEVFMPVSSSASGFQTVGFPVDTCIYADRNTINYTAKIVHDRLRGKAFYLATNLTNPEYEGLILNFDSNIGIDAPWIGGGLSSIYWTFRRAPGFFDTVCYRGTPGNSLIVPHNLGVTPEFVIIKSRTGGNLPWFVLAKKNSGLYSYGAYLSSAGGEGGALSASTLGLSATSIDINTLNSSLVQVNDGVEYVMYLFGSVPGVSKVGSYTGNGSSQTINCGFTTGARFVLIKRTDSSGDWKVFDTARGIVAAADPVINLNNDTAEGAGWDHIDPDSSGFVINQNTNSNLNVSSANYIYLAIA